MQSLVSFTSYSTNRPGLVAFFWRQTRRVTFFTCNSFAPCAPPHRPAAPCEAAPSCQDRQIPKRPHRQTRCHCEGIRLRASGIPAGNDSRTTPHGRAHRDTATRPIQGSLPRDPARSSAVFRSSCEPGTRTFCQNSWRSSAISTMAFFRPASWRAMPQLFQRILPSCFVKFHGRAFAANRQQFVETIRRLPFRLLRLRHVR